MKRIIPVMLISSGRLVKGRSFADHEDAGSPTTTARIYNDQLADEIAVLDIDATRCGRPPDIDLLRRISEASFVPIAFGGGVNSLSVARSILRNGADKVVVNTHCVVSPSLVTEIADQFGSQAVTVSLDYRRVDGARKVFVNNGQGPTGRELFEVLETICAAGAGEVILTDIDREGRRVGPDLETISEAANAVTIPVVGHGGINTLADFASVLTETNAQAAAAGRVFQFSDFNLIKVRRYLLQRGVRMRVA